MLPKEQITIVENFDHASNLNGKGRYCGEYRRLRDYCLSFAEKLMLRMSVENGTVATNDCRWKYQRELRHDLTEALRLLDVIERGEYDKRCN